MNHRQHYFVCGYPRSRTAWLSCLLTWENSFCYHEALVRCGSIEDFKALLEKVPDKTRFIGDSDPALGIVGLPVVHHFPQAKFVFVFRNMEQALEAEWTAINQELGFQELNELYRLRDRFISAEANLDAMWKALPHDQRLYVRYDDLDHEKTIRTIWDFCLPGVEFPERRYWEIDNFRVTQMFAKVMKKYPVEQFHEWVKHERLLESRAAINCGA